MKRYLEWFRLFVHKWGECIGFCFLIFLTCLGCYVLFHFDQLVTLGEFELKSLMN